MSEQCLIEVRVYGKPDALETPSPAEFDLLASVLPELILLMQQMEAAEA
ncbi:MAG: hypothetical protein IPJ38_12285 [Dechloromonas sp.]|uniref:Uncharacterized protein n=1 Tax=Candidatus Dechloromonas phosphorivorans TaxID=2899244 RepID=A0A935MWF6_9RHOO|nr:hypothetical protein [Candidatus Dechloromonas phosphorivorans]